MNKIKNYIVTTTAFLFIFNFTIVYANSVDMVGLDAPKFTINNWLTDNKISPGDLEGRVYVVEFWASWCGPCVQITPKMAYLAEKYRKDGVIFLALSQDRTIEAAKRFVEEKHLEHFTAMDGGVSAKFGVRFLPDALIINHLGKIIWRGHPGNPDFEYALAYAVSQAPPAMLKYINLGPFEDMRFKLSGTKGFTKAYKTLKAESQKEKSDKAVFAASIIKTIDGILTDKLKKIDSIEKDKTLKKLTKLKDFSVRFSGSPAAEIARQKYEKLKSDMNRKNESAK